jgi:hypothetical protein
MDIVVQSLEFYNKTHLAVLLRLSNADQSLGQNAISSQLVLVEYSPDGTLPNTSTKHMHAKNNKNMPKTCEHSIEPKC